MLQRDFTRVERDYNESGDLHNIITEFATCFISIPFERLRALKLDQDVPYVKSYVGLYFSQWIIMLIFYPILPFQQS